MFAIPGIIIIATIIVIIAAAIFLGQRQPKAEKVPITPFQLMPSVSAAEARTTICSLKREALFAQACQNKFDIVGKEDGEKIAELFVLLNKIQDDKSISDYERLLLAQAVFAVLPTKDSPEAYLYQPTLLSRLEDYLAGQNIVYAQEKGISEEEFKKMMERDLQNVVGNLPKGDNAWVINIMVSKYSWIDGKSRPLYSHQYLVSYDPFPVNPNVNTHDITYHIQSVVGSKTSGQTVDVGGPSYKGTSDMMAYSFSIMSWNSKQYSKDDGSVEEKFFVKKENFSDSSYQGEPYLNNLLDAVKMPSTKRPIESSDKNGSKVDEQADQANVESKNITCEEWINLGLSECKYYSLVTKEKDQTKDLKIYCFSGPATVSDQGSSYDLIINSRPPDYIAGFEWDKCKASED
ncbi:hypothetical protein A3C59_04160 [Candidatus Daviesbacteria bacterium RIFCSPHIGHO2_02_FULL_36_13]|uniref:Uncharacterized protein n=1 Tax=Candidatus Daviesbacteria bacterium RIFCSPHIGHO2_02_FULL_36_13 TaxID=1797768 RepID=A0A1F5JR99_9BACT|nr:MAG: hypothetical protein A3C59_04160 [Candidatus Daviesbacteria bacterium RIFCSPHIGHO2_02_FULL_36_13]